MKYYSEKLEKMFDSVEDLTNAEMEAFKQEEEQQKALDDLIERGNALADAINDYCKLINKYVETYDDLSALDKICTMISRM